MKKIMILVFALWPMLAMAQMTPEAVIGNAPALPTPEHWGKNGGHTEAFIAKIAELNSILNKMVTAPAKNITAQDFEQVQAQQMKEMQEVPKRMEQAAKGLEVMGMMMQKLDLTEADMKKLSNMNDKEAEAFMMKRMQEKGVNPNDLAAMASNMGFEPADVNTPQVDVNAIQASQQAVKAYMDQVQLYEKKAKEWEDDAKRRIKIEYDKYLAARPKNIYGLDDLITGSVTQEQYDAQQRHLKQLEIDYSTDVYRVWTELIHNCQGALKSLMQYALAADAAKAKMPGMTGNAAFDALNKSGNNAAAVAGLYLRVTESVPEFSY